jgi:hypothetical protein
MKSVLILIGSMGLICSCGPGKRGDKAPDPKRLELDSTSEYWDQNYKVYTLEGCEYIKVGFGDNSWGTHKGNCKNPIHKQ